MVPRIIDNRRQITLAKHRLKSRIKEVSELDKDITNEDLEYSKELELDLQRHHEYITRQIQQINSNLTE